MTLLADPTLTQPRDAARDDPRWVAPAMGFAGALASLLITVAVALGVWADDELSPGTAADALAAGAAGWLAQGGATVSVEHVHVDFVPLLLTLPVLACAVLSLRWPLRRRVGDDGGWVAGLLPRPVLVIVGSWWAGHALVVLAAAAALALGASPVLAPVVWSLGAPLVLVPIVAAAVVIALEARDDESLIGPRLDGSGLPVWLRRGVVPGLKGVALLLSLGAVAVVGAVALSWEEVATVQSAVGGGVLGGGALWVLQGASLPNLGIWALSFMAGPGFSVVDGASVTWSGVDGGLMPLVPVLAALPQPGPFPWFVPFVALVPLICGGLIGRWALGTIARLSSLGTKALTAGSAALTCAAVVTALNIIGGGSLGGYRLSDIGASSLWLFVALSGELLLGSLVVAAWDARWLRR